MTRDRLLRFWSTGGRGGNGRIAVRFRGGGAKRLYRLVDFKRRKQGVATVVRLEYDPNRTAFIALIKYQADGELAYILAPQRLKAGDEVVTAEKVDVKPGNASPLRTLPIGTIIHNIELKKSMNRGLSLARRVMSDCKAGRTTGDMFRKQVTEIDKEEKSQVERKSQLAATLAAEALRGLGPQLREAVRELLDGDGRVLRQRGRRPGLVDDGEGLRRRLKRYGERAQN